jgi:ribose/xylose/arabinose/galactoside ABC-type transport system permease subunit
VPDTVLITLAAIVLAAVIFNHTVLGREVRAVGGGERVALLNSIRVNRVKLLVFVGLGRALRAGGPPPGRAHHGRHVAARRGARSRRDRRGGGRGAPLTGGIGRIRGTILGVLIIAILSNGMNLTGVDPYLQNIIKGLVLIVAVFPTIDRSKISIIERGAPWPTRSSPSP